MESISATDAKNAFSAMLDKAQRAPLVIRKQNREVAVMMSMADYQRITQQNVKAFQQFRKQVGEAAAASGLTETGLKQLLADKD